MDVRMWLIFGHERFLDMMDIQAWWICGIDRYSSVMDNWKLYIPELMQLKPYQCRVALPKFTFEALALQVPGGHFLIFFSALYISIICCSEDNVLTALYAWSILCPCHRCTLNNFLAFLWRLCKRLHYATHLSSSLYSLHVRHNEHTSAGHILRMPQLCSVHMSCDIIDIPTFFKCFAV